MPTKILNPLVLDSVGIYGLNTQANAASLDHRWLVNADNIMLNSEGRLTSRKGIQAITDSIGNYPVESIHNHVNTDGTLTLFSAGNNNIYELDDSTVPYTQTAVTFSGTHQTITGNNWQWIQYDGDTLGVQAGHTPIHYDGTTWEDLTTVHSSQPSGVTVFDPSTIISEFGRGWAGGISEDKETVFYTQSANLHEWHATGAGAINMRTVWGFDEVVALASFNGKLVIFGKDNIALYNNPYDPSSDGFVLDEVIKGVGCVARDSVHTYGDDLLFLAADGVRSLNRTTIQDKVPLTDLTKNVKNDIIKHISASESEDIKAQYNQSGSYYILSFTGINETYILDFKAINPDGTPRITKWLFDNIRKPHSFLSLSNGKLYLGLGNADTLAQRQFNGVVAEYDNYFDIDLDPSDNSTISKTYQTTFKTVWMDFGRPYAAKLLKQFACVIDGGREQDVTVKWFRDYNTAQGNSVTFSLIPASTGSASLYGASSTLYSSSKFAPLFFPKEYRVNMSKSAKVVQIEMINVIKGYKGSLQSMTVLAKEGKTR